MDRRIATILLLGAACAAGPALAASTQRVSLGQGGAQGNGDSFLSGSGSAASADGRFVAFESGASNLVPGDTNGLVDVFVRDRATGKTQRVSVSTGGAQGNGISYDAQLSADGRYVAFRSQASTLVAGDTNGAEDAFVRDRQTGTTRRVSVRTGGGQANGPVVGVRISGNGRVASFISDATNLVPGDTNGLGDVFVRDLATGVTSRADVGPGGVQCAKGAGGGALSADGRFVSFDSGCANLIAGGTNGQAHAFVRDRLAGTNELVSRNSAGVQANGFSGVGNLSDDGRFVVVNSFATNLVPGDTNGQVDVFVRDRQAGTTRRVRVATGGAQSNGFSNGVAISASGRLVAFGSDAANLVPGDTNGLHDTFVRDLQARTTRRVSVSTAGAQANGRSGSEALTATGGTVVFTSEATNLVPGDTNGAFDVFVRTP